jgi:geranylgeranyl diphosphate synthase, type II
MKMFPELNSRISKAIGEISFPEAPRELYEPIAYTLALGGKRLRPLMVLASCDMFGGDAEMAIHPAIGIELFHNFTLLHDDLMDQAPLRRGKETVYKKWNANIAILAGDTMFAMANRYMLQTKQDAISEILDLFNKTAVEVCEGQQYDMNFEKRDDVSIAEYIEMIRLKTAVLIAASLKTGAIIAGATPKDAALIYNFGINIGIAFQLMDDLLDVYGLEEKFGKKTGGDIIAGKKTFLYLKAVESGGNEANQLQEVYNDLNADPDEKIHVVQSCFDKLNIYSNTRNEVNKYWEIAIAFVKDMNLPDERVRPLLSYCANLMDREY